MNNTSVWTEFATLEGERTLSYKKDNNSISILYSVPYREINVYSEDEDGNEMVVGLKDDFLEEIQQAIFEFLGKKVYLEWEGLSESDTICESICHLEIGD